MPEMTRPNRRFAVFAVGGKIAMHCVQDFDTRSEAEAYRDSIFAKYVVGDKQVALVVRERSIYGWSFLINDETSITGAHFLDAATKHARALQISPDDEGIWAYLVRSVSDDVMVFQAYRTLKTGEQVNFGDPFSLTRRRTFHRSEAIVAPEGEKF